MSIFSRLGRLARSELNDLADRVRHQADRAARPEPESRDDPPARPSHEPGRRRRPQPAPPAYPREILQAYAALELEPGRDREAVRHAYRELTRRYHPDRHQAEPTKLDTATELTRRLREAYETLLTWLESQAK